MALADTSGSARRIWKLDAGLFHIERAQSVAPLPMPIEAPVARRTSIIVQARPFRSHKLWRAGKLVYQGAHHAGGLAITNMEEEWKCHHLSAFDNFRIQLSHDDLREFAARNGAGRGFVLRNPAGAIDRTMQSLAGALAPALHSDAAFSRLFVAHITSAMMAHLLATYGQDVRRGRPVPALTPSQQRRVLDYMRHHAASNISVEEIAAQCGISAGHFTKAFHQSVGLTPHQWILKRRVDMAKELLRKDVHIAAVASTCGFADQSHFSRVFRKFTGDSPARWRLK
ncbi:hypothetical protein CAL26_08835 [Bordetella genomosp. 9]|uniref:HTH araC/xylS-type domain-containing protein n=1 Tax=Bordetella genomosp. 9 TaxID=1416803 RepID=A0A261RFI5_9BORD|nr:hypothetical protein CAL26_08835 [Bordetella genomosp. 9]